MPTVMMTTTTSTRHFSHVDTMAARLNYIPTPLQSTSFTTLAGRHLPTKGPILYVSRGRLRSSGTCSQNLPSRRHWPSYPKLRFLAGRCLSNVLLLPLCTQLLFASSLIAYTYTLYCPRSVLRLLLVPAQRRKKKII